jgi:hypothetical protein
MRRHQHKLPQPKRLLKEPERIETVDGRVGIGNSDDAFFI